MMEILTVNELANHEKVAPPQSERSNFYYSFSVLPKEEREAINSVYAFCYYIDEIVDSTPNTNQRMIAHKMKRLDWWENEVEKIYSGKVNSPWLMPFIAVIDRFHLPKQYFITLIDGCRRDLTQYRYETFEELKEYSYSVASVVGLLSIEIFGHKFEETKQYAVNLGYALQLTNILRDIKIDKNRGYIYIPREDLDRFGLTEEDIINEVYNDNFVDMMRFQADRTREFYHKARTFLKPEERSRIVAAEIMDGIYYRLLEKIELNDYNIYKRKIRVSNVHKVMTALKRWISVMFFVNRIKKSD